MRIYIIRHADPIYETDTITETGKQQAQTLAHRLQKEGITKIYCSPLGRAKATMEYTSELLNIEPTYLAWLKELSPLDCKIEQWKEAIPAWNLPAQVIYTEQEKPTHETCYLHSAIKAFDLKTRLQYVKEGSNELLNELGYCYKNGLYKVKKSNEEKIAVFCHGALSRTWLSHLLNIPLTIMWTGFWISPSSVTTLVMEERSNELAALRCIGFADISHLYQQGLEMSSMGIPANFY